jgi:spoIIIJ-associated protein
MKTHEFTGKTTQEAIDQGLSELGVTIADVRVEVLQEGAKGLFGLFGSKPAKVRITVFEEEKEEDEGLSDLLGSFSLDSNKKAKQQPKPAQEPKKQEKKSRYPSG